MSLWSCVRSWFGFQVSAESPALTVAQPGDSTGIAAAPAGPAVAIAVRDPGPDYLALARQAAEEKARERALELRADGLKYSEIAERFGRLYTPGEVRRWCREFDEGQPAAVEALPNSTIMALHGGKGSGKSLTAAAIAWEYYQQGIPVYFNPSTLLRFPPIEGAVAEFASLRDIILRAEQLRDCLIVLDELQVNLSKYRTSTKASVLIRGVIQQVRKLGMDVIITSNSPSQIDSGFFEQLDFHAFCRAHLPPEDPRDYVDIHWCDTQGYYGKGEPRSIFGRRVDQRLRFGETLWPASTIFPLFDTHAQVDPLEVMGLTLEEIALAKEEKDVGLTVGDVADFCREFLIPDLVREYEAESIVPARVVEKIAADKKYARGFDHTGCCRGISTQETSENGCTSGNIMPLVISPNLLGRALTSLGLVRRGTSKAYILPGLKSLPKFQAGAWAPGDG